MKLSVFVFFLATGFPGALTLTAGASIAANDALGKEDEGYWSRLMQETDMSVAPTGTPPTGEPPTSPPPTPAAATPPPTPSPTPIPPTNPAPTPRPPTPAAATPPPTPSPTTVPPTNPAPTPRPPTSTLPTPDVAPTESPPTGEPPTSPPSMLSPTPGAVTSPPTLPPATTEPPTADTPTGPPTSVGAACELDVSVECVANGVTCEEAASDINAGDILAIGFNYTFTNVGSVNATVLSLSSNFTFETFILTGSATFTGLILAPGETFVFNLPVEDVTVPEGGVTVLVNTLVLGENEQQEECSDTDETEFTFGGEEDDETIAEILQGDDRFSVLVALLTETGLLPALNGTGPLTLFAPTNTAFENLNLPPDVDPAFVTDVLLYHVVGEEVDLEDGLVVATLNGATVEITIVGEDSFVNGVDITETIDASNGIIYVIDEVLIPPEEPTRRNLRVPKST